jgi:hypothetical protein
MHLGEGPNDNIAECTDDKTSLFSILKAGKKKPTEKHGKKEQSTKETWHHLEK